ncbi:hypothetical protein UB44_23360 [Burkholderiaceae bacterium 26]|nr:hypothetical protein UB44_23360 [Burkholderiaceae bacterium 26]
MDLSALYPSSSTGSGITSSPLSEPAAAPAVAPEASPAKPTTPEARNAPPPVERSYTELSDEEDPDDPSRYLPKRLQTTDEDGIDEEDAAEKPVKQHEVEEAPHIDARPKIDAAFMNARDTEPAATSVTDFASFARSVEGVEPIPEGLQAMVKLGLGVTAARAIWDSSVEAVRSPIKTNEEGARQALSEDYGDKFEAKLQAAKGVIAEAEKTYPAIRQWLFDTGLGNSPEFIKKVIEFAERRG